jgi:hypothetical protein
MLPHSKKFTFTPEIIEKIISLDSKLRKEEQRIRVFADKLTTSLSIHKADNSIDDYNFSPTLQFFSSDAKCNKRNKVAEGNQFWEISPTLYYDFTDKSIYDDNWNEYHGDHPLAKIPLCYSMHLIVFDSHLYWEDLLAVDMVWIDLEVDYQFCFNL